ncbi:hypothetical protein C2G38_2228789 [Gigaspora rosea]|uniref:Uncharacterized protein n=1 Tax=Gigaspora rosea TaxID=44941 RepID=A0A397U013_9GLOM|nr:hypothetical protein C2G38_2228789 [Gigaspora rosea]
MANNLRKDPAKNDKLAKELTEKNDEQNLLEDPQKQPAKNNKLAKEPTEKRRAELTGKSTKMRRI